MQATGGSRAHESGARNLTAAVWALLLAACGSGSSSSPESTAALPPSVVLIVVDTLRADHLGCYGYSRDTSPFIDSLARRSVQFDACMTQWPKTGPAMAALFSSVYGSKSGVSRRTGRHPVPRSHELLAEVLQGAGYQTLAVVSNSSLRAELHYDQGFEKYRERFVAGRGAATTIATEVRELMTARDPRRPYFLWAHFIDPHTPYVPPPELAERFLDDATFRSDTRGPAPIEPLENTVAGSKARRAPSVTGIPRAYYLEGKEELRHYVALYDAEIRYLDGELENLFQWLAEERHLDASTVVVFTADHGESLGEHHYFLEHGRYPYDTCSRVPLLFSAPDVAARRVSQPVAHLDVVPTLLATLGLPVPAQAMGRNLLPLLAGEVPEAAPVFTESGYKDEYSIALRLGPWKLIAIPDRQMRRELEAGPYQLFQVVEDPLETRDLFAQEGDVVRRLLPLLDAFQRQSYRWDQSPDNRTETAVLLDEESRRQLLELGYVEDVKDD